MDTSPGNAPRAGDDAPAVELIDYLSQRRQLRDTLQFLAQRGWSVTGEDFFQSLVQYLAKTLGVEYALVDNLLDRGETAETIALYALDGIASNIRYSLRDAPCAHVVAKGLGEIDEGRELLLLGRAVHAIDRRQRA